MKLTQKVTLLKEDNALLSAQVDAHPDVQAVVAQVYVRVCVCVCRDSMRPQPFASASKTISPVFNRDRHVHRLLTLFRPCTSQAFFLNTPSSIANSPEMNSSRVNVIDGNVIQ